MQRLFAIPMALSMAAIMTLPAVAQNNDQNGNNGNLSQMTVSDVPPDHPFGEIISTNNLIPTGEAENANFNNNLTKAQKDEMRQRCAFIAQHGDQYEEKVVTYCKLFWSH